MLEILIISAVITAKLFSVDRQYAKQGKTPPGYRLIEKWLDGRKARGEAPADAKPAKYGMWRYLWQRWQALWELLEQDHRINHERHLKERAEAKQTGRPKPKKPPLKQRIGHAWQWVIDHVNKPPGKDTTQELSFSDNKAPDFTDSSDIDVEYMEMMRKDRDERTARSQPRPGLDDDEGPYYPPSKVHATDCRWCGETIVSADPQAAELQKSAHENICSDNPRNWNINKEDPMTATQQPTQASGEVVGLQSAINYADAVAQAHDAHSQGGGEQYMASLGSAKVGPETIQSAAAAQEATEIAAGAWRNHAAKLREQLAAKEATTAETGTKEFLLNE